MQCRSTSPCGARKDKARAAATAVRAATSRLHGCDTEQVYLREDDLRRCWSVRGWTPVTPTGASSAYRPLQIRCSADRTRSEPDRCTFCCDSGGAAERSTTTESVEEGRGTLISSADTGSIPTIA